MGFILINSCFVEFQSPSSFNLVWRSATASAIRCEVTNWLATPWALTWWRSCWDIFFSRRLPLVRAFVEKKTHINGSRVWEFWMLLESVEFWRIDSSVPAMSGQLLHSDLCPCCFADLEFSTLAVVQARHFARTWHSFCCEWILCDFDKDGISRMSWNSVPEKKKRLQVVPASPEIKHPFRTSQFCRSKLWQS